jgi:DNA-directed RNA polymerase subunit L
MKPNLVCLPGGQLAMTMPPKSQQKQQQKTVHTIINPLAREILEEVEAQEQKAFASFKEETDATKRFAAGIYVQAMNDMKSLVRAAMETIDRKPAP